MKKFIILFFILQFSNIFGETAEEILAKVDFNMTPSSIIYDGVMTIHKQDKILTKEMKIQAVGKDLAIIEFISPPRDAGTRYLRNQESLWMFFPRADRTIKISGHMLRQNMMGSDISYEDQTDRNKLSDLYNSDILSQDSDSYTLQLITKKGKDTAYYKRIIKIDKNRYILISSSMYAQSGKLLKEMYVDESQKIGDRYYITRFRMEDKIRKGSYTEIILKNIKTDIAIPLSTFSLRNLEKRN